MDVDLTTDVLVVGAGGCGLVAALAAAERGAEVLLVEKGPRPEGNTARSSGMIQAAGTRFQRAAGVVEGPADLAADVFHKNGGDCDQAVARALCRAAAPLVEWLVDDLGIELRFVGDFTYPGHSQLRMHAPPSRTGAELMAGLLAALEQRPRIQLVCDAPVVELLTDEYGAVSGAVVETSGRERVGAKKVILALNGYGGNRQLVREHCPEIADALYFGHGGNTGEALLWGRDLGAAADYLDAYQGHASVADGYGTLVTWATVMQGGFLVNLQGRRFGDESQGYSEFARVVLTQPDGLAWLLFDRRVFDRVQSFQDIQECAAAGAFRQAATIEAFAERAHLPADALGETLATYNRAARGEAPDPFGRQAGPPLDPPFVGVRVTPALFHTQGGLRVDPHARVLRPDGVPIPNLYAGGGSAAGISGHGAAGYLSGNGLLAALGLGKLAGDHAASTLSA